MGREKASSLNSLQLTGNLGGDNQFGTRQRAVQRQNMPLNVSRRTGQHYAGESTADHLMRVYVLLVIDLQTFGVEAKLCTVLLLLLLVPIGALGLGQGACDAHANANRASRRGFWYLLMLVLLCVVHCAGPPAMSPSFGGFSNVATN